MPKQKDKPVVGHCKITQKQANMIVTEAIWPKEEPCFSSKLGRHDERVPTEESGASSLVAIQSKGLVTKSCTKSWREGGKIRKIFFSEAKITFLLIFLPFCHV